MKRFLQNLRLRITTLTRSLDYSLAVTESIYQSYLGHTKVIHYRKGLPVYSLSTPPLLSKPMGKFLSTTFFRIIQNRNLPNLVSYAVNDVCNAGCEHCSFFTGVADPKRKVMDTGESKKFIKDVQKLGVSIINFVGGEPLMREDLPEIIATVDKDKSNTILFTNGWYLEEKLEALKKAGLDSIYISIDSADSEKHDKFRRKPGLFKKAFKGIKQAKKMGFSVGISTTMTPESYQDGELNKVIELAKKEGLHEVLVFESLPTGRYKSRKDLVDNNDWVDEMIESVRDYNQDLSYPGVSFFSYFTSYQSTGCSCGTSYFYMSPYGDMMSCDFNHAKFGNILEEPLYKVWDRLTNTKGFSSSKWGGCKIKDSEYRDLDTVDDGRKDAIEKFKQRIGESDNAIQETEKTKCQNCNC
jgi:MoaA/NifB/PqqE/SkfB family radical SAM enzyme